MRVLFFSILFIFYCSEGKFNKDLQSSYEQTLQMPFSYEIILNEIQNIDISKYYINYTVKEDFIIFKEEDLKKYLSGEEEKTLKKRQKYTKFSKKLSDTTISILQKSNESKQSKIEIEYQFSYPYILSNDKILLYNSVKYKSPANGDIKSGVDRIFIIKKEANKWIIERKIDLYEI